MAHTATPWLVALIGYAALLVVLCPSSLALSSEAPSSEWITPEYSEHQEQIAQSLIKPKPMRAATIVHDPVLAAAQKMRFAEHFPGGYVRASYEDRRRMVPYGGMDLNMNPYRPPNNFRIKKAAFFSPKVSNGMSMGPDPGLALANVINSQHALLQASFNDGMRRMGLGYENSPLSRGFGLGGPGWQYFNRLQRPYGVDPYNSPFSYYSPPPLPSTSTVPEWSTAGPGGSSGGSGGGGSGGGSGSGGDGGGDGQLGGG